MRIDVDKNPGNPPPNPHVSLKSLTNYAVPADNPWVGATSFNGLTVNSNNVRTEFWAVGLRNPFRFSIDPVTGWILLGDVGQSSYEVINRMTKGGNYGWIFREGTHPTTGITRPVPPGFNYIDPLWEITWGTATNQ